MGWPEKKAEYTSNTQGSGIYHHTKDGIRWYDLDANQGYNDGVSDCAAELKERAGENKIYLLMDGYGIEYEKRCELAAAISRHLLKNID